MKVIDARNVNEAYAMGMKHLRDHGHVEETRAGKVLVTPYPVTTSYLVPMERVLFDPQRDANPAFHLFESLWMLAGRRDAKFLDLVVRLFGARYQRFIVAGINRVAPAAGRPTAARKAEDARASA